MSSDVIHRRVETMLRRAPRPGEVAITTDVTPGTTLLSVQGPASRELLASLSPDDWSDAAFPYLTAREVEVGYAAFLALRVTYVGELGYELHVPADQGASVWEALVDGGRRLRAAPGRAARDVVAAAGEGLSRLRRRHREHRRPARGRPRLHDRLGQARWLRRARRAAGRAGRPSRADGPACASTTPSRCCTAASRCCSTASGSATSAPATSGTPWRTSVGLAVVEHAGASPPTG